MSYFEGTPVPRGEHPGGEGRVLLGDRDDLVVGLVRVHVQSDEPHDQVGQDRQGAQVGLERGEGVGRGFCRKCHGKSK